MDKILCGAHPSELDEDTQLLIKVNNEIEQQLKKDKQVYRTTHRLLLLGKYL